jgi:NMD protein affecting ribosome stability and mRNA decay
VADAGQQAMRCCDECGSDYIAAASQMSRMCPECAHWLYAYPRCPHEFELGRCSRCGWDGSVSAYLRSLHAERGEPEAELGAPDRSGM